MTPDERLILQYRIGAYLKNRVADANDLQCTVWADGICNLVDQTILDLFIPPELLEEGDVESSS